MPCCTTVLSVYVRQWGRAPGSWYCCPRDPDQGEVADAELPVNFASETPDDLRITGGFGGRSQVTHDYHEVRRDTMMGTSRLGVFCFWLPQAARGSGHLRVASRSACGWYDRPGSPLFRPMFSPKPAQLLRRGTRIPLCASHLQRVLPPSVVRPIWSSSPSCQRDCRTSFYHYSRRH